MSANTIPFPAQSRMFGKYFEYARYPEVVRAMHGLLAGLPDGLACVLSSLDGHHIAHSAAPMLDSARLSAVASSICGLGQTLTRDLGLHGFIDLTVQTETGFTVIQCLPRPGQQLVMMTAAGYETRPALLTSLSRHCATNIAAMCASSFER